MPEIIAGWTYREGDESLAEALADLIMNVLVSAKVEDPAISATLRDEKVTTQ